MALDISPEEALNIVRQAMGEEGGSDEAQDAGMAEEILERVRQVAEVLCGEIETVKSEVADLKKVVMEEIIGGITKLYSDNRRNLGIEGLKGSYGAELEPYAKGFGRLYPGEDMYGSLYDKIDELTKDGGEGVDRDGMTRQIVDAVKKHLDELRADLPEGAQMKGELEIETPTEGKAEESKEEEGAFPESEKAKIREMVRRRK